MLSVIQNHVSSAEIGRTRSSGKSSGSVSSKTLCSILRFMGSLHDSRIAHWNHEPTRIGPRLWSKTQPQQVRSLGGAAADAWHTAALRFMESLHDSRIAHWDHEPTRIGPRL